MALLLINIATAVELNDSIINATALPLQINVTNPIYFDTLIVNESWIYFDNLRASDTATETLDVNLTQAGDYLESDLPYYSSSTSTSKTIRSGFYQITADYIVISVDDCGIESITSTRDLGDYSCSGSYATLQEGVLYGDTTISIDYQNIDSQSSNILRNVLGVFIALGIIGLWITPVLFRDDLKWDTSQWIRYMIFAFIGTMLLIALLEYIFSITYTI